MDAAGTLLELVDLIYEAAGDPVLWTTLLAKLEPMLGTPWCFFYVHDFVHQSVNFTANHGFDPTFLQSYESHYCKKNVFLLHGKDRLHPGNVCLTRTLCPPDVLRRSEFYHEWVLPSGVGPDGISATVLQDHSLLGLIGFLRRHGDKPLEERDLTGVRRLMPHLQRAVQLHQRLIEHQVLERAARDALDRWSLGVALLDRGGRIVMLNRALEEISRKGESLTAKGHRLRAVRPLEAARLQQMIDSAIARREHNEETPRGVMTLTRRQPGRPPLHVLVAPLPTKHPLPSPRAGVCAVFVSDPETASSTDEERLQTVHHLTPAEAGIAVRLLRGEDIRQIAGELDVSLNTVRTHLKHIFDKTHTRRQSELVSLLLRDPLISSFR